MRHPSLAQKWEQSVGEWTPEAGSLLRPAAPRAGGEAQPRVRDPPGPAPTVPASCSHAEGQVGFAGEKPGSRFN